MKLVGPISGLIALVLLSGGCRQPSPIEMTDGHDDSGLITMKPVNSGMDSLLVLSAVDSGGPSGGRYFGRLEVTQVLNEFPQRSDSMIRAGAIFLDTAGPVEWNGHVVAYPSLDAGNLLLNGDTLVRLDRRIPAPGAQGDTMVGPQYQLRQPSRDLSSVPLRWVSLGSASIPPFDVTAPPPVPVRILGISPRYLAADEPVLIRWSCTNPGVDVTISRPGDGAQRSWMPVVQLRVINIKGEITIPSKVIGLLPLGRYSSFLLTVSSVREQPVMIPGYRDEVLIRSTSIHNVLLTVHR